MCVVLMLLMLLWPDMTPTHREQQPSARQVRRHLPAVPREPVYTVPMDPPPIFEVI